MRRPVLRILLTAASILSSLSALALICWRLFGHPLWTQVGWIRSNSKTPLDPIYAEHFDLFDIPYALLLTCSLILPTRWAFVRVRSAVAARAGGKVGLCSSCGYDLRATPDRCPECGTPVAAPR